MTKAAKPSTAPPPNKAELLRASRRRGWLMAGLIVLAGVVALYVMWPRGNQDLPAVSATDLDPEVNAAIETARQQVLLLPKSGDAWGELGLVLLAHELYPEAVRCFTKAEQLDQRNRRWPYFQGLLLVESDPDGALGGLRRAAALSPSDHVPHLRLAEVLLLRDLVDESEQAFQRTLVLSPNHPRAMLGLGRIALQRGDMQESLRRFKLAADSPWSRRDATAALAQVQHRLGDEAAAAAAEQRAFQLAPDQSWPDHLSQEARARAAGAVRRYSTAWSSWKSGDTKNSIALLAENIRRDPKHAESHALLGLILHERRDLDAAEAALRDAVRLNPNDGQSHMLLGVMLAERKRYDAAIESLERAVNIQATSIECVHQLGKCFALKGDRGRAIETLRTGLRYRPDAAVLHTELGSLLLEDGKPTEALSLLERAAILAPADEQTKKLLDDARRQAAKSP